MKRNFIVFVAFATVLGVVFFLMASEKPASSVEVGEAIAMPVESNSVVSTQERTTTAARRYFRPPNTEWKTRTITLDDGRTLTYEFGKGNPREVALTEKQVLILDETCFSIIEYLKIGACRDPGGFHYLMPEVENHILLALSDSRWTNLAHECRNAFRERDKALPSNQQIAQANRESPYLYVSSDMLFSPGFLDIENFILVDKKTGLKHLNIPLLHSVESILDRATFGGGAGNATEYTNPQGNCVDTYAIDIFAHLNIAHSIYIDSSASQLLNDYRP